MNQFEIIEDQGVLVLHPDEALSVDFFHDLADAVDPYIAQHGNLRGVMIEAPAFPGWKDFEAFADHIQFVKEHRQNVNRVALVTDGKLARLAPKIAEAFDLPEIRFFESGKADLAMQWLQSSH